MLEKMREGASGIFAKVVLGLVILSFVFAGVGSYINSGTDNPAVVVNGEEISDLAVERAYQNERSRMEAQLGDFFSQLASNPEYLSNFRKQIVDRLVSEKLLDQFSADAGIRVSDEELKQAIIEMPTFQLGGRFDNERFQQILRQAGMQPHEFRDVMRGDLTRRQISDAILTSAFTLPTEAGKAVELEKQTRDTRFIRFSSSLFSDELNISDDERKDYYQSNILNFDTEEKVKVEYVELNVEDIIPTIELTDADIETYYQENLDSFSAKEERRVAHILIEFGDDEEAAKGQLEGLLDIARTGADFGALARDNSADTFSAENGGDLEWIERGQMDPAFEEAAYALENTGDISDVVKTEFGFHIIKLTDFKAEQVPELADVKAEITTTLQRDLALEQFYDLQTRMSEVAFEMPDAVLDVAEAIEQEVKTSELFSRNGAPVALSNPAVLNQVFSDEAIEEKINSDLISLDSEHVIVVRVMEHEPRRTQSIDEVTEQINEALLQEKAVDAAVVWAKGLTTLLSAGESVDDQLQARELEWELHEKVARRGSALPSEISSALFKLSPELKYEVVELVGGDVALLELQQVNQLESLDDTEVDSTAQRLAMQRAGVSYQNMLDALKEKADIQYTRSN